MKPQIKPRAVLLSKRANVFYLEHVRVMQKDDRVVYLTDTGADIEQFFNIPERNTAFLLLGKGSSLTDAAARKLADSNVVIGFCGSGGSPLFCAADMTFLTTQSEYRPTEYMQGWMRLWLDDAKRVAAAKRMLKKRLEWTLASWSADAELLRRKIGLDDALVRWFENGIDHAAATSDLLSLEGAWAKRLYARLAEGFRLADFKREEGKGSHESREDDVNGFLDHGNYIAYGYAAVTLNGLGISFALPLLHGKTRRGGLVFDVADLVKDAYVMPLAFARGSAGVKQQAFRDELIERFHDANILDQLFTFVEKLSQKSI
ncbi:MAG: type I-F CRISPR-associated endonuclease Cas1f [Candidatus Competibacter sp.]|nr:type I-F CRISPR-associated endonuclease Cas1 [Candidatus Competibacteraceae bacterium]